MRDKKAAGDHDESGDILKFWGETGLRIRTQLMNSIYETGEWPMDFTEIKMTALNKKPKATKCSHHRTISLIAHTAKTESRIIRRGLERKAVDILGDHFGFRRGEGSRDAVEMSRIISE